MPIVIQDDSLPAGPPPQIRILKRPTSNGVVNSPNSTSRPALSGQVPSTAGGRVHRGLEADPGQRQPGEGAGETHPRQANQDLPIRRQQAAQ
ncbi:hypothetical protein P7K49_024332 [Saguinus oedipus]|uniref:Uncharacterized protein n=1 Tax=Saguinus oedipus TaxID=9490 RepID=A0ABQ9UP67_SAGOE|nr:hypothetical protein P7K49_024332 [Saguinus oedipus]